MTDKVQVNDGYTVEEKGYQPGKQGPKKPGTGDVTGGYQPTQGEGDNPTNPPPKKP